MPGESPDDELNSGARWHRWDPHVHAPGTVLNDQFKGADKWEDYLKKIEASTPPIRALGITDYYNTETYEQVVAAKKLGRLPNCDLIFPNVEMRFDIGTVTGKQVNLHLIVSPEDPDHLKELHRFLGQLTFSAYNDTFTCTKDDLIRLGKRVEPSKPEIALKTGSLQFKISLTGLKKAYNGNAWAKKNILIGVAGGADGTSGVREAADATLREEIEKFAHVIFASSPAQREFWLGQRRLTKEELETRFDGLKPCMHGSDAHTVATVGAPNEDRYSWIKGAIEFDALHQACIDPAGRAFVGSSPPMSASPSQVIASIEINGAPWAKTPKLGLNPGLVAIIGARGSGKTALADMIAHACGAMPSPINESSFLARAQEHLRDSSIALKWQAGDESESMLDGSDEPDFGEFPRARYLSQQFVEDLCSARGMTDKLLREIERVVFEAHTLSGRDGATDFSELREMKTMRFQEAQEREEEILALLSDRIGTELEKEKLVVPLKKQVEEKEKLIKGYVKDRSKLVVKGDEARVERLNHLTAALEKIQKYLTIYSRQEQALLSLRDEVVSQRTYLAPESLRIVQEKFKAGHLSETQWQAFLLDYKGDVDAALTISLGKSRREAAEWKGTPPVPFDDEQTPFIAADADLEQETFAVLQAEIARLEKQVGADKQTKLRFAAMSQTIAKENSALEKLNEKYVDSQGAKDRAVKLVAEREGAYTRAFDAITSEEQILTTLYEPLMTRLKNAAGTLKKLSLTVSRKANVESWATEGEGLIDLRQKGPAKGLGSLRQLAEQYLKTAWESGTSKEVAEAMAKFRTDLQSDLLDRIPKGDQAEYRAWSKRFAKWLYGTGHISIEYSIDYDGVDIRKLSPGTRGIVLLLLYLALDDADDRPLIIDQPEENLDPKSIFDELVSLFLEAKNKRQVIMVTHNANLVINTDADQIIIAQVGPGAPDSLPPITYLSGGLENEKIRRSVCEILEGGERAFRERARRLRVRLDR